VAFASSEIILQKMHESVIFDLILERWDRRWIAKGLSIGRLNDI
jgi:hypothetical protein